MSHDWSRTCDRMLASWFTAAELDRILHRTINVGPVCVAAAVSASDHPATSVYPSNRADQSGWAGVQVLVRVQHDNMQNTTVLQRSRHQRKVFNRPHAKQISGA